jgi:hypothetical protein
MNRSLLRCGAKLREAFQSLSRSVMEQESFSDAGSSKLQIGY